MWYIGEPKIGLTYLGYMIADYDIMFWSKMVIMISNTYEERGCDGWYDSIQNTKPSHDLGLDN